MILKRFNSRLSCEFESDRFRIFIFLLAVTSFYAPILNGSHAVLWDTYEYSYPIALYLKDSIASGILPLWNPFILSGDPVSAHPAVSAYHPFNLIVALAPNFLDSFTVYQMLTASCPLIGAAGAIYLSRTLGLTPLSASIFGSTYGIAAFGPLLGQVSVSFSTAMFPWTAAAAIWLLSETRVSFLKSIFLGTIAAIHFWGGYFGSILYSIGAIAIILTFFCLRVKPPARASILNISLSALVFLTLTAPHVFAVIENRNFYFSEIHPDFKTPDPRVRGIGLHESQVVEVIPNERTLIGILTNNQDMASDGAFWVLGPGYLMLGLLIASLMFLKGNRGLTIAWLMLVIGTSYLLGPKSLVFDLVFEFVPLLNGIRYPVFFYPFFVILVALISSITFDLLTRRLSVRLRSIIAFTIVIETLFFGFSSDIYSDRIPHIIKSVESDTLKHLSLENRKTQILVRSNLRTIQKSNEIIFFDKTWVTEKGLSNHGYSTADTPAYWYIKDSEFLRNIAYCPSSSVVFQMPTRFSNQDFETIGEMANSLESKSAVFEYDYKKLGGCNIREVFVSPNKISVELDNSADSILVVNNKNYPGWRATIDGDSVSILRANFLFSGVQLPNKSGMQTVTLSFEPLAYLIFLWITVPSMALYSMFVGVRMIRRLKEFI